MPDFPTSVWTPLVRGTNMSDAVTHDIHDDVRDEVVAVETELGTNPSGAGYATVSDALNVRAGVELTRDTKYNSRPGQPS